MKRVLDTKPYTYSTLPDGSSNAHWVGHDILGSNRKNPVTGLEIIDEAAVLGLHLNVIPNESVEHGIRRVRDMFDLLDIHEPRCKELVNAADGYKLKKDERLSEDDKPVYFNDPVKDWRRHLMDALRHLAWAYRFGITVNDQLIGYPYPIPACDERIETFNALDFDMNRKNYKPLARRS